ncbi:MAG: cysteine hydrolase family protein [Gammaproteobacteria bacterium]
MNSNTVLLLVDIQTGLDHPSWGKRNNPDAESRMGELLQHWRKNQWPVIHVQHCSTEPQSPLRPDQAGVEFKPATAPESGETVFQKNVNSAFIGTSLEQTLKDDGVNQLVVVGLTTDHCVSTTVRMAANKGFDVLLVGDATATFDRTGPGGEYYDADTMHNVNLASLNGEFCSVVSCDSVLHNETTG